MTDLEHDIRGRVRHLETEQARQGEQIAGVRAELGQVSAAVASVAGDVKQLVQRDAGRPEPASWRTIAGSLAAPGAADATLWGGGFWIVAQSPAVADLDKRVTRLDDAQTGRVPAVEKRVDRIEFRANGWGVRVEGAPRK